MGAVFYLIIALIAFVFPKVIAGFFSVVLGVVLILFAIVNVVRALGLRAFGGSIWIAVLVAAVIVGVGGVLIVVNAGGPRVASMIAKTPARAGVMEQLSYRSPRRAAIGKIGRLRRMGAPAMLVQVLVHERKSDV